MEILDGLKYELQQYYDNASKGTPAEPISLYKIEDD